MDKLRAAYRTAVIIGFAMMASLVAYLIVVSVLGANRAAPAGEAAPAGAQDALFLGFIGIAIVIALLVRSAAPLVLKAGGGRGGPTPGTLQRLTTAAGVTYALCELPAGLGLVLFLLGRSESDFYLFLLISLFSFSVSFPKFSQWEEWYRQRRQ
jgi:hypothetical protein